MNLLDIFRHRKHMIAYYEARFDHSQRVDKQKAAIQTLEDEISHLTDQRNSYLLEAEQLQEENLVIPELTESVKNATHDLQVLKLTHENELIKCKEENDIAIIALNHALELEKKALSQHKGYIEDYSKQIAQSHKEQKELIASNERLIAQIKAMNVVIMDNKDVSGKPFSRLSPFLGEEEVKNLQNNVGRLRCKLTHIDGSEELVWLAKG